ncbi:MAG: hypothetical protein WCO94_01680 [Verrucomicrobiota bacterium]
MKVCVIPTIRDYPWGAPGHCMGELVQTLLEAGHEVLWFVAPIDWENADVAKLSDPRIADIFLAYLFRLQ